MLDTGMNPVRYDLKDPARSLVEDGAPDFGITEPFYNGTSAFDMASQGPALGNALRPVTFTAPQATTAGGYQWRTTIASQAVRDIDWTIRLPPRPAKRYWEFVDVTGGNRLYQFLLKFYLKKRQYMASETIPWIEHNHLKLRFLLPGQWVLRMYPQPGVDEFMSHILAHEYQHVEDHAWLAEEIFRPLDDWHEHHANTVFLAHEKANLFGVGLCGTAESHQRILGYWVQAIIDSGNLYHDSDEGDHPIIHVVNIERPNTRVAGLVEMTVTPRTLLRYTGFDLDDPLPHGWGKDKVFKVATGKIGGNEPRLDYLPKNQYRRRQVDYGHAVPGLPGCLGVDTVSDDDMGLGMFKQNDDDEKDSDDL